MMTETVTNPARDRGKREVISYINKLSAFLSAKKKKAILEADLLKIRREIKYMRFGMEETQKKIDRNRESIRIIIPDITGFREKLASLEQEKRPLEEEYNRLFDIQTNLEKKRADIESKKAVIERLAVDIRRSGREIEALKERETQILAQTREMQEQIEESRSLAAKLEEEIGVITTTRDLLGGQIPDFIDAEEVPSLIASEQNAEEYVSEVSDIIKKMEKDVSAYKKKIEKNQILEASLTKKKKNLTGRLEALEPKTGSNVDKDRLIGEIAALSTRKEALTKEIAARREEILRLSPMVTDCENKLLTERKSEAVLQEEISYLTERKKIISALENVEEEMERLTNRITTSSLNVEANNGCLPIIEKVNEATEAMCDKLGTSFGVYAGALREVQHILLLGHRVLYGNSAG